MICNSRQARAGLLARASYMQTAANPESHGKAEPARPYVATRPVAFSEASAADMPALPFGSAFRWAVRKLRALALFVLTATLCLCVTGTAVPDEAVMVTGVAHGTRPNRTLVGSSVPLTMDANFVLLIASNTIQLELEINRSNDLNWSASIFVEGTNVMAFFPKAPGRHEVGPSKGEWQHTGYAYNAVFPRGLDGFPFTLLVPMIPQRYSVSNTLRVLDPIFLNDMGITRLLVGTAPRREQQCPYAINLFDDRGRVVSHWLVTSVTNVGSSRVPTEFRHDFLRMPVKLSEVERIPRERLLSTWTVSVTNVHKTATLPKAPDMRGVTRVVDDRLETRVEYLSSGWRAKSELTNDPAIRAQLRPDGRPTRTHTLTLARPKRDISFLFYIIVTLVLSLAVYGAIKLSRKQT